METAIATIPFEVVDQRDLCGRKRMMIAGRMIVDFMHNASSNAGAYLTNDCIAQ